MGMFSKKYASVSVFSKPSCNCQAVKPVTIVKGNPNPSNYKIKKYEQDGIFLAVFINYPDCKNYEGDKILVFSNVTIEELKKQKIIDPHFSDNDEYHSPIARFQPTHNGWVLALEFIRFLQE